MPRHRHLIEKIKPEARGVVLYGGDAFTLLYEVNLSYHGDTEENLRALKALLADDKVVLDVNVDALNQTESVFVSLLDRIRDVKAAIAARGPT